MGSERGLGSLRWACGPGSWPPAVAEPAVPVELPDLPSSSPPGPPKCPRIPGGFGGVIGPGGDLTGFLNPRT